MQQKLPLTSSVVTAMPTTSIKVVPHHHHRYRVPYRRQWVLLTTVLTVTATIMTWYAAFACTFLSVQGSSLVTDPPQYTIGLWTVQQIINPDHQACVGWNDHTGILSRNDLDGPVQVAKGFSFIACIVALYILLLLAIPVCRRHCSFPCFRLIAFALSLLTFSCLCTLRSHICRDARECRLDTAGWVAVAAGTVWLLTGFAAGRVPRIPPAHVSGPHIVRAVAASHIDLSRPEFHRGSEYRTNLGEICIIRETSESEERQGGIYTTSTLQSSPDGSGSGSSVSANAIA
ncbi:predicted protein [Phaeodactylum tricornutum CCAP 1055/1]|uniref:Uncharacterized protein n=2 Tax=Phaeodactylum tricornutum TaxID=2850 RepID=B7FWC2_PHATC|nr:predicted protein [Phaeodactylum tricornutum CCAP 1055/1]EEC48959.1 predicted protein [Phaeodactylum tricornutum CCAP 1055/1]|eukprot:XP_002179136.1 predicted protein [Phaeodactylum tricornutum CCAP 1055/1]